MENAFAAAQDIHPVKALRQHWTQEKFSYLSRPRPDHGLMLLIRGRIDFVTPTATLCAHAGDVIYLPKGCFYEAVFRTAQGAIDNYLINFESAALHPPSAAPCLLLQNAPAACAESFRAFVEEYALLACPPLRSTGLLLLLLHAIFRAADHTHAPRAATLAQAQTLLKDTTLSVRDIARQCSLSESSLRALFQENLGTSPAAFRLDTRLSRAAYLLESTDMTISEIADALHFYDAAYFCRTFRKHFSLTPRQYAQSKHL